MYFQYCAVPFFNDWMIFDLIPKNPKGIEKDGQGIRIFTSDTSVRPGAISMIYAQLNYLPAWRGFNPPALRSV